MDNPAVVLLDVYSPQANQIDNRMHRGAGALGLLFEHLEEREPHQAISHKTMPTWEEHLKHVFGRPHQAWYLFRPVDWPNFVGNIYLSRRREVGIHVAQEYRGKGYGTAALAALREHHPGPLLANINPENKRSIEFFLAHGAHLIQKTYEL